MKLKKTKLPIVFAALLCTAVFCSGCAKDAADRSAGAAPAGAQVTADSFALSAGARMITDVDGLMGNPVASTENGRYQVLPREDGSENIIYIDYATRSCIYLCSRPECRHGDASCPAWLSAEDCAGGAGFFTDGETLYLQRLGAGSDPGSPGSATETSASQIIRMDLNGGQPGAVLPAGGRRLHCRLDRERRPYPVFFAGPCGIRAGRGTGDPATCGARYGAKGRHTPRDSGHKLLSARRL